VNFFDPIARNFRPTSISLSDGVYAKKAEAATKISGNLVLSLGLTDLHTHLFVGQDLGVRPEEDLIPTGVTQAVDTGSAGGHLFEAFRKYVIDTSPLKIKAFVNIASIGTTSIYLQGELKTPNYVNVDLAVKTVQEHSDVAIGIKVRASHDVGGDHADSALIKAREAADKAGVPLMVHLGPAPATIDSILGQLGSGDFLTHCYTGWQGNTLLDESGKPRESVVAAIKRGVKFDVGHGAGGFDSTVASAMIREGFLPDAISTDLHAGSIAKVQSLPKVMSKFLALGMSMTDVFSRSSAEPGKLGRFSEQRAEFNEGERATFTIFEVSEGKFQFSDVHGHDFEGTQNIEPKFVVLDGKVILDSLSDVRS